MSYWDHLFLLQLNLKMTSGIQPLSNFAFVCLSFLRISKFNPYQLFLFLKHIVFIKKGASEIPFRNYGKHSEKIVSFIACKALAFLVAVGFVTLEHQHP